MHNSERERERGTEGGGREGGREGEREGGKVVKDNATINSLSSDINPLLCIRLAYPPPPPPPALGILASLDVVITKLHFRANKALCCPVASDVLIGIYKVTNTCRTDIRYTAGLRYLCTWQHELCSSPSPTTPTPFAHTERCLSGLSNKQIAQFVKAGDIISIIFAYFWHIENRKGQRAQNKHKLRDCQIEKWRNWRCSCSCNENIKN